MNHTHNISKAIIKQLANGEPIEQVLSRTKLVLNKYKLETLYPRILTAVQKSLLQKQKEETLRIQTPFDLSDKALQKIIHSVGVGSDVSVSNEQNKTLLAGWKAVYKGYVYDASAQKHIQNLRKIK